MIKMPTAPNWVYINTHSVIIHHPIHFKTYNDSYYSYRSFNLCFLYVENESDNKTFKMSGRFYLKNKNSSYLFRICPYIKDYVEDKYDPNINILYPELIKKQEKNKIKIHCYICSIPMLGSFLLRKRLPRHNSLLSQIKDNRCFWA